MPRLAVLILLAVGAIPLSVAPSQINADESAYRAEVERFQQAREASLRADDGWLSVSGLGWLKPGANRIGSDPASEVALRPAAPASVGVLTLPSNEPTTVAQFQPAPGVAVLLNGRPFEGGAIRSDVDGAGADVLAVAEFRLILLRRNDRFALRVKDNASPTRANFAGCRWFPVNEDWRVIARFTPHALPKTIRFETTVGGQDVLPCPGVVSFEHAGQTYRLEAAAEPDGKLWFVFRDATAGATTAANARQLTTDAPVGDVVILDFNRAINLPCAYIEHATCPIAPPQNRLPLAIPAAGLIALFRDQIKSQNAHCRPKPVWQRSPCQRPN